MEHKANGDETAAMDRFTAPQPRPLPARLPAPADDGAAEHLVGQPVPRLALPATMGGLLDLAALALEGLVLYAFPKMGPPDEPDPHGWADIPGAYGCTQQSCSYRDRLDEFAALGYAVVGLSAQSPESQRETHDRLGLRFPLVADPDRRVGAALGLPTFAVAGMTLYPAAHARRRGRRRRQGVLSRVPAGRERRRGPAVAARRRGRGPDVIARIWRTGVDPARVGEYRAFAERRSLPMFRSRPGFLGVLFAEGERGFAVITLWLDRAAAGALERSDAYRATVADIVATGFLTGAQGVEVLDVAGGDLDRASAHLGAQERP